MNKVILTGNVGKIEGQYTPTGKYVCKATLAVTVGWGDNKKTQWYNLANWGNQGERMCEWADVSSRLLVEGTLDLREWTDKEDVKHISPDVTVSYFEVIGKSKKKKQNDNPYEEVESEEAAEE